MNNAALDKEQSIKYSKLLSSFFCSMSIFVLTILCILNYLTLDIYSTFMLLKIVAPAAFLYWLIGQVIGRIFDKSQEEIIIEKEKEIEKKEISEKEAYEIPSMFAGNIDLTETLNQNTAANDESAGEV